MAVGADEKLSMVINDKLARIRDSEQADDQLRILAESLHQLSSHRSPEEIYARLKLVLRAKRGRSV
ncbi:protein of unknown function [Pseudorhizobium banfieldiae]|uniref:Uncharacterized protein n=1 Tax=Pseudorhizobium banfieldiae TaxID=1125847 RepID=L0NJ29_9HYPH|nr:hypothetical protein [Pseudorhizobium banfieldiae]CAD6618568.1 hypothetical protein RNT25_03654 [arsenite-oxidising bacterium NT-25]CCF21085.1 protein of unknown function [Pseudorhizobium banfieldiae]